MAEDTKSIIPVEVEVVGAALHCDFCGKSQHEILKLVKSDYGRKPMICDECIGLAVDIIRK